MKAINKIGNFDRELCRLGYLKSVRL